MKIEMKFKKPFSTTPLAYFLAVFLFFGNKNFAQNAFFPTSFPVEINGKNLKYPFAGGLNAPQFSTADLNKDGKPDLVVFDRIGNHLLTFLNKQTAPGGSPNYEYAPEFALNFPILEDWALLRDFDNDGAADIFCSSLPVQTFEIQVFKGFYDGNVLKFKPFKFHYPGCSTCETDFIYYPDEIPGIWNNLSISSEDIPEFADMDSDGDIDILTFEASVGGHVWLFNNKSAQQGFGDDSLHFELADRCWGRFYESGMVACKNGLSGDPDTCVNNFQAIEDRDGLHPGSTVTTFDEDGDGDKEIILGDISFPCLNKMTNGGTKTQAWMVAQDTFFPSYNVQAEVVTFPAAFILDADGDGKNDMLVSPNSRGIIEDQRNVWFYKNTGSNSNYHFELQKTDFLTGEMIDFGTITHPAFADVNADGLLDLVVGTQGFFSATGPGVSASSFNARLFLFLNKGSSFAPDFKLADSDWLGMSQYAPNDYEFSPAFGDLDKDGDEDLMVGSQYGAVFYFKNVGGQSNPMIFQQDYDPYWLTLDISQTSTPYIIDLDGDGKKDLLMGERSGNINFFKNDGTAFAPHFPAAPTVQKLGGLDAKTNNDVVGFSNISFVKSADGLLAVMGIFQGKLEAYKFTNVNDPEFPLVSDFWGQVDVGTRSHPAFADLDNDGKLDMVIGNSRGGLQVFKTDLISTSDSEPISENLKMTVSPNPATRLAVVNLNRETDFQWQTVNVLGQILASGNGSGSRFDLIVKDWPTGIYLINVLADGRLATVKLVVEK